MKGFFRRSSSVDAKKHEPAVEEAVARARDSSKIVEDYEKDEKWLADLHALDSSILDAIFPKPCSLFDAMMGPGRHLLHFAKKGYDMWGNDYNSHMVGAVRKALKKAGRKARLFNLDATALDSIPKDKFDGVLCMGCSLGCIPGSVNRQRAFSGFARVTKPGGLVVAHIHNRYSLTLADIETMWFWLSNRKKGYEFGDIRFYHGDALGEFFNHSFSIGEARSLCKGAGLVIEGFVFFDRKQEGLLPWYIPRWMCGGFVVIARKPR